MRLIYISIAISAIVGGASVYARSQTAHERTGHGQSNFCPDISIERPVATPAAVLKVVLSDKNVKQALPWATDEERANPEKLFNAAELHLHASDELDLLVVGKPPVSGADNTWFWIIRSADTAPKIVLAGGANCVEIRHKKTAGLSDIWVGWNSASQMSERIYRFNGTRYKMLKEKWSEIH